MNSATASSTPPTSAWDVCQDQRRHLHAVASRRGLDALSALTSEMAAGSERLAARVESLDVLVARIEGKVSR